jgi:exosortase
VAELSSAGIRRSRASDPRLARAWRWAVGAGVVLLGWAYAPNFRDLSTIWSEDPNYSHGYLVVPIAIFILWRRLADRPWEPSRDAIATPWWGWVLLAAILALRVVAYEGSFRWLETATLVPAVACLAWTVGGWPLLHRAWPAIVFLVFMLPLPDAINARIALPLQRIATSGSYILLQLSGFWALQEGNVIRLRTLFGMRPLDVALACNGLRMLMCMAATVTATVVLIPLPHWKRIVLLLSAVPIAMLSNMIRIVATGWCYYYIRGDRAQEWAHDISGLLMMPLALVLVGLELAILAWLVPEVTAAEAEERKTVIPLLTERGPVKSQKTSPKDLDERA